MKLNSFKELLLKKAQDNKSLQFLVKNIQNDFFVDYIIESLEKMAAAKNPNQAVKDFGSKMDEHGEGDMIYDALSHHASKYKAALNAGQSNVANQHMHQYVKTMGMLGKLTEDADRNHTQVPGSNPPHNKLNVHSISPHAWERQKFLDPAPSHRPDLDFNRKTKGWSAHEHLNDYGYLQGAPHESHAKNVAKHGHTGAYPLEETMINGRHIAIDDNVENPKVYEPHVFDTHPIMSHFNKKTAEHLGPEQAKYMQDTMEWNKRNKSEDSPYSKLIEKRGEDAHFARGKEKSAPVHKQVDNPLSLDSVRTRTSAPKSEKKPAEAGISKEDALAQIEAIKAKYKLK